MPEDHFILIRLFTLKLRRDHFDDLSVIRAHVHNLLDRLTPLIGDCLDRQQARLFGCHMTR